MINPEALKAQLEQLSKIMQAVEKQIDISKEILKSANVTQEERLRLNELQKGLDVIYQKARNQDPTYINDLNKLQNDNNNQ